MQVVFISKQNFKILQQYNKFPQLFKINIVAIVIVSFSVTMKYHSGTIRQGIVGQIQVIDQPGDVGDVRVGQGIPPAAVGVSFRRAT